MYSASTCKKAINFVTVLIAGALARTPEPFPTRWGSLSHQLGQVSALPGRRAGKDGEGRRREWSDQVQDCTTCLCCITDQLGLAPAAAAGAYPRALRTTACKTDPVPFVIPPPREWNIHCMGEPPLTPKLSPSQTGLPGNQGVQHAGMTEPGSGWPRLSFRTRGSEIRRLPGRKECSIRAKEAFLGTQQYPVWRPLPYPNKTSCIQNSPPPDPAWPAPALLHHHLEI